MHRLLLILALVNILHLTSACIGDEDSHCCFNSGQLWCDSSSGCGVGGQVKGWCQMATHPGSGMCWRGRINICTASDDPKAAISVDNITRPPPVPPTAAEVEKDRRTLDLHGDGSARPAVMLFREHSTEVACVGTQFVQLGSAKLRTGCPKTIEDLGLQLSAVVFGGYVAEHNGEQAVQRKLIELGFSLAPAAV